MTRFARLNENAQTIKQHFLIKTMEEIILKEIAKATSNRPITSTRLIDIVLRETGEKIQARKVRKIIEKLRKVNRLPILATRKGDAGYYTCRTIKEFQDYKKEVRNHALRELATISEIEQSFFGTKQQELLFI